MKRLIVRGGNGFIGRHFVKKLLATKQCYLVLIAYRSNVDREMQESLPLTFYAADREVISNIFRDESAKISVADPYDSSKILAEQYVYFPSNFQRLRQGASQRSKCCNEIR